jgi:hypothetical protein
LIICSEEVSGSNGSSSLRSRDGFITRCDKSFFVTKLCHPPVSDVGAEAKMKREASAERSEPFGNLINAQN